MSQEKTEKPTGRRLQEARKKGNVAKSQDVNTGIVLLAGIIIIKMQFGNMAERMGWLAEQSLGHLPTEDFTVTTLMATFLNLGLQYVLIVAPTLGLLLLAGLIANYLQVGVLFSTEAITPKLSKINPIAGFKRIFSRRSVVETIKAILKMSVVGYLAYQIIASRYAELTATVLFDKAATAALFASVAWEICWKAALTLFIFGILDFFYQRWEHEKGLRMSKQEIKDEGKQTEGDPMVKGRIRRLQREAARRRMMQDVPTATVVITNPTHFAVALKYDRDSMDAPKCVAKGMDLVAQKIKEIAAEADVPMIENVPLARALYKKVEIDETIPEDMFAAVAEILVTIDRLNKKKKPKPMRAV
ncbi:Flagellar biosynthetic protein FlhB [compost metagenome]